MMRIGGCVECVNQRRNHIETEYYLYQGLYLAFVKNGMFVYRSYISGSKWEFVQSETVRWHSLFEEFRRYKRCEPKEIEGLPPLPPVPDCQPMQWRDNFLPEKPVDAADYPNIERYLKQQPDFRALLYIILKEDRYETAFGDGTFLYYDHTVFLSAKEADDYAVKHTSPDPVGRQYHVRSIRIKHDEGVVEPVEFDPGRHEHYHLLDVLKDLENLLA